MLYSEQIKQFAEKLGVDTAQLKDGLYSTTLKAIYDACGSGGGSGGGGGVKIDGEVILPQTTIELNDDGVHMLLESIGLIVGETYTAVIAGYIYEAQATEFSNEGMTLGATISFGDYMIIEVFPEYREMVGGAAGMVSSRFTGGIEFMIVHGTVSISYLDRMTLPVFKVRFTVPDGDTSAITADKTLDEALFAAQNGYDFKAELSDGGVVNPIMLTCFGSGGIWLTYWSSGKGIHVILWNEDGISHG